MTGKNKCKILKEIRKAIAKENNIEYVTSECKYQGNCRGTCPKCESEVRYLEKELEKRRLAGKTVAVAGIATSMILSSGCSFLSDEIFSEQLMGDVMVSEYSESSKQSAISESSEEYYEQVDGQIQLYSSEEIFSSEESKENSEAILSDEIIITESGEVETVGEIAQ